MKIITKKNKSKINNFFILLKKIAKALINFKLDVFILFCLILITTATEAFSISLIFPLLESFNSGESSSKIINTILTYLSLDFNLREILIFFFITIFFKNFLLIIRFYYEEKLSAAIRQNYIDKINSSLLINASLSNIYKNKIGTLNTIIVNETVNTTICLKSMVRVISAFFLLIFLCIALFTLNPNIQTLYILSISLVTLLALKPLGSFTKKLGVARLIHNQNFSGLFSDFIINIKQLKLLSLEQYAFEEIKHHSTKFVQVSKNIKFISQLAGPILETFFVLVIAFFLIFYMYYSALSSRDVLPILGLIILVGYRSMTQIRNVIKHFYQLSSFYASFNRIDSLIFNLKNVVIENKKNLKLDNYNKEIKFENIIFGYNKKKIFSNFNLTIPAKAKVLISGKSGSGKSTLIDLLVKFQKPKSGRILLNGQNIDDLDDYFLRKKISYVSQEVLLFNRSIYDNIKIVKPNLSNEDFNKCANLTLCSEFINDLPKKESFFVGERGIKLSGGQRQRIGILRAIINKPDVLILDETLNALDKDLVEKLLKNLLEYLAESTIIIISHSNISQTYFDKVIDLNKIKDE